MRKPANFSSLTTGTSGVTTETNAVAAARAILAAGEVASIDETWLPQRKRRRDQLTRTSAHAGLVNLSLEAKALLDRFECWQNSPYPLPAPMKTLLNMTIINSSVNKRALAIWPDTAPLPNKLYTRSIDSRIYKNGLTICP
jgi:hypothetical protein